MRFTLSQSALLAACAYPFGDGVQWHDDGGDDDREWGDQFHALAAAYINRHEEPRGLTLEQATTWLHAKAYIDGQQLPTNGGAELAFAYDPVSETSGYLGREISREYEKHHAMPDDICGTVDACLLDGSTAHVYEWSTSGNGDLEHKKEQGRAGALVVGRHWDVETVVVHLVRFVPDGAHVYAPEHLDMFQIAAIEERLKANLARIGNVEPTPGVHCVELRCPHRAFCPVTQDVVSQVLPAASLVKGYRMTPEIADEAQAAWMIPRVQILLRQGEDIKKALETYAAQHGSVVDGKYRGIPLPDGKVWMDGPREIVAMDYEELERVARRYGATDEDIATCMKTKGSRQGFRARKPRAQLKKRKGAAA